MKFRSIQLWTTIVALVLAPFFFGSVDLLWVVVWTILLSGSLLAGLGVPLSAAQSRIVTVFLALCGIYALVAAIQIIPNLVGRLNDDSWMRADQLLGFNALPRISSRAEIPPLAVGHFLLFVTSFLNGFLIGTSRSETEKLVRLAQFSILLYAIYGIFALIFTPDSILWAPKTAYRGSLTSTFINHNTAATFLGVGAIMWCCAAFSSVQSIRISSLRVLLLTPSNERVTLKALQRSTAALVCFFALVLTGSRGGLISSVLGLFVAILLMITRPKKWNWMIFAGSAAALVASLALLTRTGRIASVGLFDDARWSVYRFCVRAIKQRPLLGSGAGTFPDVFPSLRTSGLSSWGVWDYAHSTVLEIAVEMGIPVASMVVLGALASLFVLGRAAIKSTDRGRRFLAATAGIAALAYLHSLVDFSLQIPGFLVVFGVLLGCGLAAASSVPGAPDGPVRPGLRSTPAGPDARIGDRAKSGA